MHTTKFLSGLFLLNEKGHSRYFTFTLIIIWSCSLCLSFSATAQEKKNIRSCSVLLIDTTNYSQNQLLELLKHGDDHSRQFAVMQLTEQDSLSDKVLKKIIGALADSNENVRFQALAGLMRLGPVITDQLIKELSNKKNVGKFMYFSNSLNGRRYLTLKQSDLAFTALYNSYQVNGDAMLKAYGFSPPQIKKLVLEILEKVPIQITPSVYKALSSKDIPLAVTAAKIFENMGNFAPKASISALSSAIIRSNKDLSYAAAMALASNAQGGHTELRKLTRMPNTAVQTLVLDVYPLSGDSSLELISKFIKTNNTKVQVAVLDRLHQYLYYDYKLNNKDSQYLKFIYSLPDSIISEVKIKAKSKVTDVRLASISALGSIAILRSDHAQNIANYLLTLLADEDKKNRSEVISQLSVIADKNVIPDSKSTLSILFEQVENTDERQVNDLFKVIEKIKSEDEPVDKFLNILINTCVTQRYLCDDIVSVLQSKRGWADKSIHLIIEKYPNLKDINEQVFNMLILLKSSSSVYSDMLQLFLSNPEKWMRLRAAITLSSMNMNSKKVIDVLEEGAKSFDGYAGTDSEAADALAKINPEGAERIIKIINDSKTSEQTRNALVYYSLNDIINDNERAADILMFYAKDTSDVRLQESAVWALRSFKSNPNKLYNTLNSAFSTRNEKVRYAVVYTWSDAKLPSGDFINRVLTDTSSEIRKLVFKIIDSIPLRRKISITEKALDDVEDVREAALEYLPNLGVDGLPILESYLNSGKPLSYYFFTAIKQSAPLGEAIILSLQSRKDGASIEEKKAIDEMLTYASNKNSVDVFKLYDQLKDTSAVQSLNAARTLLSLNEDPWDKGGLISAVLMQSEVNKIIMKRLGAALDYLYPPGVTLNSGRFSHLPPFPWPPPVGYKPVVIPFNLFKSGSVSTFGGIYKAITTAMNECDPNFEYSLFGGIPNGYALLARIEHIDENGAPFAGNARWTTEGTSNSGFFSLLGDLFFEKPGYFRIIAFAITDDLNPGTNHNKSLPDISNGLSYMPDELARIPRTNQQLLALVYTFKRSGKAKIMPWTDGIPSAKVHLEKSGIWTRLK